MKPEWTTDVRVQASAYVMAKSWLWALPPSTRKISKSWLSPCFGSSPHLHAYMQTDLTAFLLYAIRRPSRDVTMEWPSSRRKRKHTQGFGNREPRCQSSGLLGKLKTDSRISERIAFCRVLGWRGLTVKSVV